MNDFNLIFEYIQFLVSVGLKEYSWRRICYMCADVRTQNNIKHASIEFLYEGTIYLRFYSLFSFMGSRVI